MVSWLVRMSAPVEPKMKFCELLLKVNVPVPLRVVLALLMNRSVPFPPEVSSIVPELLMLEPETVRETALGMNRVFPEASVKLSVEPAALSETMWPEPPMTALVVLLGTPAVQLLAVFQSPPPGCTHVVVVTLGAPRLHKLAAMFQSSLPSIHRLVV